jgi:hypothetical protein
MPGISQPSELAKRVLDRPFTFHEQPVPIPAEYRTRWRVALLLLLMGACRGHRARWHQLHVLNWASRTTANEHAFERLKNGESRPEDAVVRYDPSLDRAIDLLFSRDCLKDEGATYWHCPQEDRMSSRRFAHRTSCLARKPFCYAWLR